MSRYDQNLLSRAVSGARDGALKRWRTVTALGVAGALLAGVTAAATVRPQPSPDAATVAAGTESVGTCDDGASTFTEAAELAATCERDVEWTGGRTEFETTFATPEGYVRRDTSTGAVRARSDDGSWVEIDTTISASGEDGRLAVAAAAYPMSFSDGTPGEPLARIERDGHVLEFDAPFALTDAEIRDGKIVYPGVLGDDGISLIVSVDDDGTGFREVIQVDSPASAANPALATLTFPVEVSAGLEVVPSDDGLAVVQPSTGDTIFKSPAPHAWDSAGDSTVAQPVVAFGRAPQSEGAWARNMFALPDSATGTADPVDRTVAPVDGDLVVPLETTLSDDQSAVTIEPGADLLSGAAGTTWPLYIDPSWTGNLQGWAYVQSAFPTTVHWRETDQTLRAGLCTSAIGCSPSNVNRSAWQFDNLGAIGALHESQIVSATFAAFGDHSYNCTATEVQLWWTGGINAGTTWNNLGWISHLSSQTVAHKASCSNQRWIYWDATQGARETAKANASQLTLGLRAGNEGSVAGWHRYRYDAQFSVVWSNSAPYAPSNMRVADPATHCANPWVRSKRPTLSVVAADPDSPSTGEKVLANFEVWTGGTKVASVNPTSATYASGSTITWKVPVDLKDGVTYTWHSSIGDSQGATGPSAACTFTVDATAPVAPKITPVSTGVDAVYDTDVEAGGVGMTGKFTIGVGTSTDVEKFLCSFVSANQLEACATPASNQISYTPTVTGPTTLYVASLDRSGQRSGVTSHRFDVSSPAENGLWVFDDGLADLTATDTSSAARKHHLALTGGASQVVGPHQLFGARATTAPDHALSLDGSTGSAQTSVAVVDTTKSYTVAALVRLAPGTVAQRKPFTALGQDGKVSSGFTLGFRPAGDAGCAAPGGCWAMSAPTADGSGTVARSVAPLPVIEDRWTLLVGERNATAGTVRVWACDVGTPDDPARGEPLAGAPVTLTQKWAASGPFTVGRAKAQGAAAERWPGAIDDVRVFSGQVVAESKVRRLCQGAEAGDFPGGITALDPTEPIDG